MQAVVRAADLRGSRPKGGEDMSADPFGHLENWGAVLQELCRHEAAGTLGDVQPGLIRLIRYRCNWRLREQGLLAAAKVDEPVPELVRVLLAVVADESTYADARILAARALAATVPRRRPTGLPDDPDPDTAVAVLKERLLIPEAPVVHAALEQAIHKITDNAPQVSA
jgi:hypothetical protein